MSNTSSVYVIAYFAVTDGVDTFVFFDHAPGLTNSSRVLRRQGPLTVPAPRCQGCGLSADRGEIIMKTRITWGAVGAAGMVVVLTASLLVLRGTAAFAAVCGGNQGGALLLGCDDNTSTDETELVTSDSLGALFVQDLSGAHALEGFAGHNNGGIGVEGSGATGLYGTGSSYGVKGTGNTAGVYGTNSAGGDAIQGVTTGAQASAIYGHNISGGGSVAKGVFGSASGGGTGVRGESASGHGVEGVSSSGTGVYASGATALQAVGKVSFSRSGIATIPAGSTMTTVSNVPLTSASFVLATVQDRTDISVKSVVRSLAGSSFKIVLTKAATLNTLVGWMVIK